MTNNLRQLSHSAEEYYNEKGFSSVNSVDLVGTNPTQYVKAFVTVANESYTATLQSGLPITASGVAGTRTVTIP